ncbi:alpha/beta fold hydrolase [Microbacterium sp. A196]|uniref:alpha/beta fold hydrolase n=1 Tax=unclassified Microbacterium TaxID=2609290 RepID=UPI003F395394
MKSECSEPDRVGTGALARRLGVDEPRPERRSLPTSSGSLSALQWGVAPPQIILLHGAGLHAGAWSRMLLELNLPALAIDLPGHGVSDHLPVESYRIASMADMLAEALDSIAINDVVFVGHSLGSFVAACAASSLGGVSDLVVLDATPHRLGMSDPTRMHSGTLDELVEAMLVRMPQRSRESLERSIIRNTRPVSGGRREWLWDPAFVDAAPLRARERESVWRAFASAAARTVLLRAERGGVTEDEADEFARRVPRAQVTTVAGAGHNLHSDRPDFVAERIRGLLEDGESPSNGLDVTLGERTGDQERSLRVSVSKSKWRPTG